MARRLRMLLAAARIPCTRPAARRTAPRRACSPRGRGVPLPASCLAASSATPDLGAGGDQDDLRRSLLGDRGGRRRRAAPPRGPSPPSRPGSGRFCRVRARATGPCRCSIATRQASAVSLASAGRITRQAGDGAQRGELLDRLVGRAVLAQEDRVVGVDEDRPAASSAPRGGSSGACSPRRSGRCRRRGSRAARGRCRS